MTDRALSGLQPCVHCGFCLQSCPTYLSTGDEADSPRGRIVLLKGLLQGRVSPQEDRLAFHLDRCLGCRSCESACPSGVRYGPALERARYVLNDVRPIPLAARIVNTTMANGRLWRPLLGLARSVRPVAALVGGRSRIGMAFGMLAASRQLDGNVDAPGAFAPSSSSPAHLFTGCIMDGLFSHVHDATERTLKANGLEPVPLPGQVCCGALHAHSGQHDEARELARKNVLAFGSVSEGPVIVNSAGCGAILKEYGDLLAGDPLESEARAFASRVVDVAEALAQSGPRQGANVRARVAYDAPCHLLHAQGVADAPRQVLQAVPGLELVHHSGSDQCCGGAGSYTLTERRLSSAVLDRKVASLLQSEPDFVATGNPGCIMQIGAGLMAAGSSVQVVHPVEILDMSYQRAGLYDA